MYSEISAGREEPRCLRRLRYAQKCVCWCASCVYYDRDYLHDNNCFKAPSRRMGEGVRSEA